LDFKIGEIWVEIDDELSYQGVRPVSPDLKCIETAHAMTTKKALDTLEKQKELARKDEEHQKIDELAFYKHFLESKKSIINVEKPDTLKKKNRVHVAYNAL